MVGKREAQKVPTAEKIALIGCTVGSLAAWTNRRAQLVAGVRFTGKRTLLPGICPRTGQYGFVSWYAAHRPLPLRQRWPEVRVVLVDLFCRKDVLRLSNSDTNGKESPLSAVTNAVVLARCPRVGRCSLPHGAVGKWSLAAVIQMTRAASTRITTSCDVRGAAD